MDRDAILAAMRDGWVLYTFGSTCRSYLVQDDHPRLPVPFMVALRLVREGLVTAWGPHSYRLDTSTGVDNGPPVGR